MSSCQFYMALIVLINCVSGEMAVGTCPAFSSNIENSDFNHTNMGGLWYEYLYQPEYSTYKFECGTWNILVKNRDNLTDSEPVSFDLLHHEVNKTSNNATSFAMYNYECGTPGSSQIQSCKLEKKAQRAFVETLVDPTRTT